MKSLMPWIGALLIALATLPTARADFPFYPCAPQAPDACNCGYFCTNNCGLVYGPNYCLRPPWPPFNGLRPSMQECQGGGGQGGIPGFPVHPFARSPRDYFMIGSGSQDYFMGSR